MLFAVLAIPAIGGAQLLPDRPVSWLDGRVAVSGSISLAAASGDSDSYFNTGDYEQDTMRLVQLGLVSSILLHSRATVEADLRLAGEPAESNWYFRPRALVLRVQPLASPLLKVSAGLLQPAFGTLSRRGYGRENLLIGRPLLYQYASSLRADALPLDADDLARHRGRGAEAYYYLGRYTQRTGLPLVDPAGWNAGVEVGLGVDSLYLSAALTDGSVSNPGSRGTSGGWQGSARLEARPTIGLVLGTSAAHGPYLDGELSAVVSTAVANRDPRETALGFDVEYSRDYWLVRAETVHTRRSVPALRAPLLLDPLTVTGFDVEGRYRLAPGLYAAARLGYLAFGDAPCSAGSASWDASVGRVEAGAGWSLRRGLVVKAAYQYNRRDMQGPLRSLHRVAVEGLVWF